MPTPPEPLTAEQRALVAEIREAAARSTVVGEPYTSALLAALDDAERERDESLKIMQDWWDTAIQERKRAEHAEARVTALEAQIRQEHGAAHGYAASIETCTSRLCRALLAPAPPDEGAGGET